MSDESGNAFMELKNINQIETATQANRPELFRVGVALLFVVGIMLFALMRPVEGIHGVLLVIAAMIGLPVSSTHIAVGGVFGVGFLREYLKSSYGGMIEEIKHHHKNEDNTKLNDFLDEFKKAILERKKDMLLQLKTNSSRSGLSKKERKQLKKVYAQQLVKRSHLMKIAAAWVITVPASALMAALIYFMIRGILL